MSNDNTKKPHVVSDAYLRDMEKKVSSEGHREAESLLIRLSEREPVKRLSVIVGDMPAPKCPECRGRGKVGHSAFESTSPCDACSGTGKAGGK